MPRTIQTSVLLLLAGIWLAFSTPAAAETPPRQSLSDEEREASYYQPPTYRPDPRAIIHEKAQARAYQRQARMASMNWYGMSNSRPIAASTPFTSRYSPVWEMPGGRPYSWHPTDWPTYFVYRR